MPGYRLAADRIIISQQTLSAASTERHVLISLIKYEFILHKRSLQHAR